MQDQDFNFQITSSNLISSNIQNQLFFNKNVKVNEKSE